MQLRKTLYISSLNLANPTGRKHQAVHGFYSVRQRSIPVEGNNLWAPLGVCNLSAGFGLSNWPGNLTSRRIWKVSTLKL